MKSCGHCGSTILSDGIATAHGLLCSEDCFEAVRASATRAAFGPQEIEARIEREHRSFCPRCRGPGPVDAHRTFSIMSFLVITRFGWDRVIGCRRCARLAQARALFASLFLGWWGFPLGVLTPLFVLADLYVILFPPAHGRPSEAFRSFVTSKMAPLHGPRIRGPRSPGAGRTRQA